MIDRPCSSKCSLSAPRSPLLRSSWQACVEEEWRLENPGQTSDRIMAEALLLPQHTKQAKARSGRLCGSAAASYRGGRTAARLRRRARSQSPTRHSNIRGPLLNAAFSSSASSALAIQRLLELELKEDKALTDDGGHHNTSDAGACSPRMQSSPVLSCSHGISPAFSVELAQIQCDLASCREQLKQLREQVEASEQLPSPLRSPLHQRVREKGGDEFEFSPPL